MAGILAGLVLLVQSCDRDANPVGPDPPDAPAPVRVVRIDLTAPSEIAPGASVQLTAVAVKSDGSSEAVTDRALWTSSNALVATISAAGVATGVRNGEVQLVAYHEVSASARVFVLPAGTFRLTGLATENGRGVPNVTVTVTSGVGEGLATRTGSSGDYTLYGVSGRVGLRASRDGYVDARREVEVSSHLTQHFELQPDQPVPNLAGTYELTVTAGCRASVGTLPDSLRRRTYTAAVAQQHRQLDVTLSGAEFILANGRGNHFEAYADAGGQVTFEIGNVGTDYSYYSLRCSACDLVERLSATNALVIGGRVAATPTSTEISGILFGTFWLAEGITPPLTRFPVYCTGVHDFVMRRQ